MVSNVAPPHTSILPVSDLFHFLGYRQKVFGPSSGGEKRLMTIAESQISYLDRVIHLDRWLIKQFRN